MLTICFIAAGCNCSAVYKYQELTPLRLSFHKVLKSAARRFLIIWTITIFTPIFIWDTD